MSVRLWAGYRRCTPPLTSPPSHAAARPGSRRIKAPLPWVIASISPVSTAAKRDDRASASSATVAKLGGRATGP